MQEGMTITGRGGHAPKFTRIKSRDRPGTVPHAEGSAGVANAGWRKRAGRLEAPLEPGNLVWVFNTF